jgi:hypothetical protein
MRQGRGKLPPALVRVPLQIRGLAINACWKSRRQILSGP